jgi:hypothetical protein
MPAYVLFKNKEKYIIYAIDYSKVLWRQARVEGLGAKVFWRKSNSYSLSMGIHTYDSQLTVLGR